MEKNKKQLMTCLCILTFGVLLSIASIAQSQQKSSQDQLDKEWDALMKKNASREGGRAGGQGGSERRGFGGGGYGSRFGQVNPEEFMNFMNTHVPNLAGKLKTLRVQNPEKFRQQFSSLSRLFGPVMREMERNPEMGELSLGKITNRLQVEQQVKEIKGGQDTPKARTQLRTSVGKLFDVIIALEGKRVESWKSMQDRFQNRGEGDGREGSDRGSRFGSSDRDRPERGSGRFGRDSDRPADGEDRDRNRIGRRNSNSDRGPSGRPPEGGNRYGRGSGGSDRGDGRFGRGGFGGGGFGGRGGFGGGGFGRGSEMLEEYQTNIEAWTKNRSRIIDNQVDNLLKDIKPFPWGR